MKWAQLEGLAVSGRSVAAAVAVGVTATGCVYLLTRDARGKAEVCKVTTLAQLQRYAGLGGQLNGGVAWLLSAGPAAVVVPGQGSALSAFPLGLCSLPNLVQLNLSGSAIAALPPQISRLRHLRDLDLGRCRLGSLPREIGGLTALKYLNLMGNQLEKLPEEIGRLTALYRLGLKSNRLRSLPASIGGLSGLVELFITDNLLESLPPEMGKLTSLVKCQVLPRERNDASFNERLTALPLEMGSLPELELLRVACCHIADLPASFASLRKLAWLSLASNPLNGCQPHTYSAAHLPVARLEELEMGRKLGEGASGEVFQAQWRGRQVAVKIFQAEKSPDGHSRDEMAIAVALSAPGLIRMLGVLERPLGLVMELVQGRALAEKPNFESLLRCRWAPGRTFGAEFVLRVATAVASALEHMHYRGVAHGDVYAHNVLADDEGNAYLCDFGASFFYQKGGPVPFEGQEVRAFGLFLNDMVDGKRFDIPFTGMQAALAAQKQLVRLAQSCMGGAPAERPCFGQVVKELRAIHKELAMASKNGSGGGGGAAGDTPLSTPTSTSRGQ